jgi:hypothetical protein
MAQLDRQLPRNGHANDSATSLNDETLSRNKASPFALSCGVARPIACTLDASDLRDRARGWQKLLGSGLERECCARIDYDVSGASVAMTAEGAGEAVLAEIFAVRR